MSRITDNHGVYEKGYDTYYLDEYEDGTWGVSLTNDEGEEPVKTGLSEQAARKLFDELENS